MHDKNVKRAEPPLSPLPPDRCGSAWSAVRPRSSVQGGERRCRCSLSGGAWAPAGTLVGPETAPCCWGWSWCVCLTAGTPSLLTGSSCGGWELGLCWSSWSGGSLGHCPIETVKTAAKNSRSQLNFWLFQGK